MFSIQIHTYLVVAIPGLSATSMKKTSFPEILQNGSTTDITQTPLKGTFPDCMQALKNRNT